MADHVSRDGGMEKNMHATRVCSTALPSAAGVTLQLAARGVLSGAARRVGLGRGITTGDRAFDEKFRMTGAPAGFAAEYMNETLRREMLHTEEGFLIVDDKLFVEREGLPRESATLVAMVQHAKALATRWLELTQGPSRVAKRLDLSELDTQGIGQGPILEARTIDAKSIVARGLLRGYEIELSLLHQGERVDLAVHVSGITPAAWPVLEGLSLPSCALVKLSVSKLELRFDGLAPSPDAVLLALEDAMDAIAASAPSAYR